MADPLIDFVESVCVQDAVYWGNPVPDAYGKMQFDAPEEIKVRWDDSVQVATDDKGKEFVSKAQILCLKELDVDGRIMLGTLDDIDSADYDNPQEISGTWRIKRSDKNPLFQSTEEFVHQAFV